MFFLDTEIIENKPTGTAIEQFTLKGIVDRKEVTL